MAWTGRRSKGFMAVEVAAVVTVISLLLAMGFMLYRSMRLAARVSVAESNLKQISTGMELYFRKYSSYPPQGSDLTVELAPFIDNPEVFENPLTEETVPGETINQYYHQPTVDEADSPNNYVTAMVSEDGKTVIILETGNKVERRDDLPGTSPEDLLASLNPEPEPSTPEVPTPPEPPEEPIENTREDAHPNDYTEEMPAGVVTSKSCFDAEFKVIRSALTWGQEGPSIPITVRARFHHPSRYQYRDRYQNEYRYENQENTEVSLALFGGEPAEAGRFEVRTVREQEAFTLIASADYTANGNNWSASCSSDGDSSQVLTLRNGDLVRDFSENDPGMTIALGAELAGLIDPSTGTVTIQNNQVLYLFELGTASRGSSNFDYQDLAMLVTLSDPVDTGECQDPPEEPPSDGGFEFVDNGTVLTKMCSDIRILAVGSQFGYADGRLVDIIGAADVEKGWFPLYNSQPIHGGETYTEESVPAGTKVTLRGEIAGAYERWLWTHYGYPLSYASTDGSGQVLTLKNGDAPVTFKPGYAYQASVGSLLAPYVDPQTGVVSIADNEALYLWDFNPLRTRVGIDYQDLIILATAVAAERECGETTTTPPAPGESAHPVLTFTPTSVTTEQTSFTVTITNTGTNPKDVATNVQLNAQVTAGGEYVNQIACNSALGSIGPGESRDVTVSVDTRTTWLTAVGKTIKVHVKVLNEDNNPAENEGKAIDATINAPTALHPVLALYARPTEAKNNNGHGNNLDHDDEDNPGNGGGSHGADEGYDDDGFDDDEMGGGSARTADRQCQFEVLNSAAWPNNAANVRVAFEIVSGAQYVESVTCPTNVGAVPAADSRFFSVKMFPNWTSWNKAKKGTEVCIRVRITHEDNNPNANIGKSASIIIVK